MATLLPRYLGFLIAMAAGDALGTSIPCKPIEW